MVRGLERITTEDSFDSHWHPGRGRRACCVQATWLEQWNVAGGDGVVSAAY